MMYPLGMIVIVFLRMDRLVLWLLACEGPNQRSVSGVVQVFEEQMKMLQEALLIWPNFPSESRGHMVQSGAQALEPEEFEFESLFYKSCDLQQATLTSLSQFSHFQNKMIMVFFITW